MNEGKVRKKEQEGGEQKLRKWLWGERDVDQILLRYAFILHLVILLNKSTDTIKQNRFIMCNSDYITRSKLSRVQNKSMWQMKSINQHSDFPSPNSSVLRCRCVRLSSSISSMVKPPSIETERTKSFQIHGDASPRWITRKSGNIHQPLLASFFLFFSEHLILFSSSSSSEFHSHFLSPRVFPQNISAERKIFSPPFTFIYQGLSCGSGKLQRDQRAIQQNKIKKRWNVRRGVRWRRRPLTQACSSFLRLMLRSIMREYLRLKYCFLYEANLRK